MHNALPSRRARRAAALVAGSLVAATALTPTSALAQSGYDPDKPTDFGHIAYSTAAGHVGTMWFDGSHRDELIDLDGLGNMSGSGIGTWSADGEHLALSTPAVGAAPSKVLDVAPYGSGGPVTLGTTSGIFDNGRAAFSPDRSVVAVAGPEGLRKLVNGVFAPAFDSSTQASRASWSSESADGTLVWDESGVGIRMRKNGVTTTLVGGQSSSPSISQDGKTVAYVSFANGYSDIRKIAVDPAQRPAGGDGSVLVAGMSPTADELSPAISADGNHIVYSRTEDWGSFDLWRSSSSMFGSGSATKIDGTSSNAEYTGLAIQPARQFRPANGERLLIRGPVEPGRSVTLKTPTFVRGTAPFTEMYRWQVCDPDPQFGTKNCVFVQEESTNKPYEITEAQRDKVLMGLYTIFNVTGSITLQTTTVEPEDQPDTGGYTPDAGGDTPQTGDTPAAVIEQPLIPQHEKPSAPATPAATGAVAPPAKATPAVAPRVTTAPSAPRLSGTVTGAGARTHATTGGDVVVKGYGVGVDCSATGTVLTSCAVDLYAENGAAGKARAASLVLVGTGTTKRTGKKVTVDVALNATGRRLLARSPKGLDVSVRITGKPASGAALKVTRSATLVPQVTTAVVDGFAVDRAVLPVAAQRELRSLARRVRATAATVRCVGHTDNTSDDADWLDQLGLRRAKAVCAFLRTQGVAAKVTAASRGAAKPVASNGTDAGRAQNRRVELRIVR